MNLLAGFTGEHHGLTGRKHSGIKVRLEASDGQKMKSSWSSQRMVMFDATTTSKAISRNSLSGMYVHAILHYYKTRYID